MPAASNTVHLVTTKFVIESAERVGRLHRRLDVTPFRNYFAGDRIRNTCVQSFGHDKPKTQIKPKTKTRRVRLSTVFLSAYYILLLLHAHSVPYFAVLSIFFSLTHTRVTYNLHSVWRGETIDRLRISGRWRFNGNFAQGKQLKAARININRNQARTARFAAIVSCVNNNDNNYCVIMFSHVLPVAVQRGVVDVVDRSHRPCTVTPTVRAPAGSPCRRARRVQISHRPRPVPWSMSPKYRFGFDDRCRVNRVRPRKRPVQRDDDVD